MRQNTSLTKQEATCIELYTRKVIIRPSLKQVVNLLRTWLWSQLYLQIWGHSRVQYISQTL